LGQEAALVRALLDRYDGPAHLVGHSYGGAVALNVAHSRGAMLRSLTLIEPVAFHLLRDGNEAASAARGVRAAPREGGTRLPRRRQRSGAPRRGARGRRSDAPHTGGGDRGA